jgi:biotin-(acetyl-CoA carboxylase) ligase
MAPMADALASSLGRLASLTAELGSSPSSEQLDQLRSATAAALAAAKGQAAGAAQQKRLWEAASGLWVRLNCCPQPSETSIVALSYA